MNKFIIFLIRKKLGVRKYEGFRFTNQRVNTKDIYYFTDTELMKFAYGMTVPSKASFNWLLDPECQVVGGLGDFSCL